ncbi:MAG: alpha/beta hydrolase [Gammaproteobacteria bacterium]|nr:alpha/beta hydrolase [Gammaproteobacteria bacterium]
MNATERLLPGWLPLLACIGLLSLPVAPTLAQQTELDSGNQSISFTDCILRLPGTTLTAKAQCGSLLVAENPAQTLGSGGDDVRSLSLRVARVPASDQKQRLADPIFFFAGGPGQAATEAWPIVAGALREANKRRDVILVDQRGTGGSNKLQCDLGEAEFVTDIDLAQIRQQTRECLAELDADPRYYTTSVAAGDIEAVRQALGLAQINLIGVSYGTRAAQVYLRNYPEQVRSVVLDSVAPPQVLLGTEHAPMLDLALERIFARCREQSDCFDRFGNPAERLQRLRAELASASPSLTLRMPTSGKRETIAVTSDVLAVAVRLLSYASETQALLPIVLEQADLGDWQPLTAQALMQVGNLTDMLARGMEMSVICSEDVPFYPATLDHSDTLLGNTLLEVMRAQCEVWPRGEVPADFHQPLNNDEVPVLLLSGEVDPVTPPRYAEQAAKQFARSAHWVIPGQGHSVLRHGCVPDKLAEFLDQPEPDSIDASCVDDIKASPFFLSLLGPSP